MYSLTKVIIEATEYIDKGLAINSNDIDALNKIANKKLIELYLENYNADTSKDKFRNISG